MIVAVVAGCQSSGNDGVSGDGAPPPTDGSTSPVDAAIVADGAAPGDGPASADADGVMCFGQRCAPGLVCCPGCSGTSGSCGPACPGFVCPVGDPPDAGNLACTDKRPELCGPGRVCDLDQQHRCTASTAGGTCIVKPTACTTDYQPVCGCDGHSYGNDCTRQMAGVQLDHLGACEGIDAGGGGVRCGSVTCAADEYCVQDCPCGGPPSCGPRQPGVACGAPCTLTGGGPGCQPTCTLPPPRCTRALETCAGAGGTQPSRAQIVRCSCPP